MERLTLSLLPNLFAVCRLEPTAPYPPWRMTGAFYSITRTADELTVVCPQAHVPAGVRCEADWRCLKVEGPLDFAVIGILANLSGILARAKISLFAISTFETDYVLVKANRLDEAIQSLINGGHQVNVTSRSNQ